MTNGRGFPAKGDMEERANRVLATLLTHGARVIEVFVKEGYSIRAFLSGDGTRTVSFVREEGIAVRAWGEKGAEGFVSWVPSGQLDEDRSVDLLLRQLQAEGEGAPDLPGAVQIEEETPATGARSPALKATGAVEPLTETRAEAAAGVTRILEEVQSASVRGDRQAIRLEGAWCESGRSRIHLLNSCGLKATHESVGCHLTLSVTAGQGEEVRRGYLGRNSRVIADLDPRRLTEELSWRTAAPLGGADPPAGRAAVLLDSTLACQLLQHMAPVFVASEETVSALRESRRVGPPGLRIVEQGPAAGEAGWDGEGLPRRPFCLVEDGRLVGLLTDLASARRFGLPPTGSAHRLSFRDRPAAAPASLRLTLEGAAGANDMDRLLGRLAPGLFLTTARFFHAEGVSGGILVGGGMWIQGGRVAGPVRTLLPLGPLGVLARLQATGRSEGDWVEGAESGSLLVSCGL